MRRANRPRRAAPPPVSTPQPAPARGHIERFSSRLAPLDRTFLARRLKGATSYRRIAGYFRSSIFELVGEEIANIPDVRIVCNSDLSIDDVAVSKAVRDAAITGAWNEDGVAIEGLLHRDRYRKLYDLLAKGNVKIRVVPREKVFLHGKAGVIEGPGGRTCFIGSVNETRSAFADSYEILWEDRSPEGADWVDAEFEALWADAYELPEAIIREIKRVADRIEVTFPEVGNEGMAGAALAEAPIYRRGEQLQPWQRAFVALFLEHRERYGRVRLLLADEVGLGKTLSMGTSAMVSALLDDGPVLILCPSTLCLQWQAELMEHLGIPSAVWASNQKFWIDPKGHVIKTNGAEDVAKCPYRIAIVSTGLVFHNSAECGALLRRKFNTVILDEAHKARLRGGLGVADQEPNNLLAFMMRLAGRTTHLLLGTATPIQTEVRELWDLLKILNVETEFVLGQEITSIWDNWEQALPLVTGQQWPTEIGEAWELLRNPLPPGETDTLAAQLRTQLGLAEREFFCGLPLSDLGFFERQTIEQACDRYYFWQNNPVLRHVVLRKRKTLEDQGLLERIGVNLHPDPKTPQSAYPGIPLNGLGLVTNHPFNVAYEAAEEYTKLLGQRTNAAGFIKSLMLQRICSSFAAGKATAQKLLRRELFDEEDEDAKELQDLDSQSVRTPAETVCLQRIVDELSRPEARDPKLDAVNAFLTQFPVDGKTWLEHGCIIFSQYYDTAYWIASELAATFPDEPIAVYAGLRKSGVFREGRFGYVPRNEIKALVKRRELRLLVATEAACEGLNLQTLGTMINIDLPWNPSRLQQRLGRIKRFGQARPFVDMANLVYHDTRDETVYDVISKRLKDVYDIFGSLPDIIESEWIEDRETLEEMIDKYIHLRDSAKNAFEVKYEPTIEPDKNRWELCSTVLSRDDVVKRLSSPW